MTPVVSVITPAFNATATLERAYRSLHAQTFGDWEYIVVDDGSSDRTAEMVGEFQDPRVRAVLRTANRGTGAALNAGVQHSAGGYLAFLDADDEFLPNHLEAHVAAMEEQPEVDLLWGGVELVVKDESQAWIPDLDRGHGLIYAGDCVVQGTLFVRRRVFEVIQYTEDRSIWYQDYDLVRKAEAAAFRLQRFLLKTYRYYRDSGESQIDRAKAGWLPE